ncbi:MAG: hypothetical protein WCF18_21410 [Chthoniobacteraceae bacterium]
MKSLTSLLVAFSFLIGSPLHAEKIVLVAGGGAAEKDAPATECKLKEPFGVEFLPSGEMIIVEMTSGNRVLKVDAKGLLRVIGGTGTKGYTGDGGPATAATFNGIHNLQITPAGDLLIADSFNHTLRRMEGKSGVVSTMAGDGKAAFAGDGGPAAQARFSTLIQIALDAAGQQLYIADIGNKRVRRIELASGLVTTIAGNGKSGVPADGAVATDAPLVDPRAVTPDALGGFYILERGGNALRYVDSEGKIRTVVGTGGGGLHGDGGPGIAATMSGPKYLTMDHDGTVLIADAENHVIRRYAPTTGLITRVAGTGKKGTAGLGGSPLECELARPHGVTVAKDGTLFITDSYNDRILKIVP